MIQSSRLIAITSGLIIVAASLAIQLSDNDFIKSLRSRVEAIAYDLRLKYSLQETTEPYPGIIIVDIDEKSLAAEGHWPWPRHKLAKLVDRLFTAGISVLAFDIVFAEAENDPASLLLSLTDEANLSPALKQELTNLKAHVNGDEILARSFQDREIALGYVLTDNPAETGRLGQAINAGDTNKEVRLSIPEKPGFTGNIDKLVDIASNGGFFNASPDADGILRSSPLLYRYQDKLYPSLALETARQYFVVDELEIKTASIGDTETMEHISLGFYDIPTDSNGRVLIPYRGKQGSFSYVSATDILNAQDLSTLIPEAAVAFVGTTAQGLFDWRATPVSPVYPGVEVHATILAGIMEQSFPYRPVWARGADFAYILACGIMLAALLPFLSPLALLAITTGFISITLYINTWLWQSYGYAMSMTVPVLSILLLATFNLAYGFLIEMRRKNELKEMFGQYIPPALVDEISRNHGNLGFDGESREMTVLFADIRSFTTISESLSATELKNMLNLFFTPMTEIIFQHRGTIDKYVGDMIMAFWGAPLADKQHARHAIEASLQMLQRVKQLKKEFTAHGLPEINIGIGLNSGTMNVGNMGSEFRRAYTVLGDNVNLASRIEGLSKFYGVEFLVSEMTMEGLEDVFVFRFIDKVQVMGKSIPVNIYQPVCSSENAGELLLKEIDAYNDALEAYFSANWEQARKMFTQLKAANEEQSVYNIYLERINELENNCPQTWDGVYTHTGK